MTFMKRIIRSFVYNLLALFLISRMAAGFVFENGHETFFIAGGALTIATLFAKPVINVLLLPLNLITFGLFRWVSSAIALYLVTLVVPAFEISKFSFFGLSTKWLDIPSLNFEGFLAYVAFSFLLSFTLSFLYWVRK